MLSPHQQRGRLRALVVRELKRYNLAHELRNKMSSNNQIASGHLAGQISYYGRDINVSVRSSISSDTGYLEDIDVEVSIPWGDYGRKIDEEYGSSSYNQGMMIPSREALVRWIDQKGISTELRVNRKLKNGQGKTYQYSDTRSSKSAMAYNIQKNIIKEQELRTRYDYSGEIKYEVQDTIDLAVGYWFEEIGEDFMGDVFVEIGNIFS